MKQKGFTLIELLAVIVILSIIALIATPVILGIINNTKEESKKRSIDNIVHAAQIYYAQEKMKDPTLSNKIYIKDIKDKIDGEIPENGYIIINESGEVTFTLEFKDKTYVKSYEGEIKEEVSNVYYLKVATQTNGGDQLFFENPYNITKEQIEKVVTVPTNKVPSDVIGSWDVTDTTNQEETGKVMAWYYDKDNNNQYEVYIGQEGGVKANPNSRKIFNYIINAKEIDLTYLDTSDVIDMTGMFQRCENVEKIIGIENFNTRQVMYMSGMFNKCLKLQFINLKNFDTSQVTAMNQMFDNCQNLTTLDVSNFDTSNTTAINSMFTGCIGLKEIDVSNFDTSNVTNMKLMFAGAELDGVQYYMQLERIIGIENFNTSQVTNMQGMFQNCINLTTLDLRKWDTRQVTDMGHMFYSTTNLKPIYVGSNWKTATTVTSMFGGDAKTQSVDQLCSLGSVQEWCVVN